MVIQGGRIGPLEPDAFEREPIAMLRMFHLAQERDLDIHPEALRAVTQNLKRIGPELREDPAANALFMAILTSRKQPATALRRMNEAGLLGRFLPEFGRVVAQMEHSLYHVYTVDEHTIRAIGVLHDIEAGLLGDELPLATSLMPKVLSRTELYVALFFHDLGKGRGGDHSTIGAGMVRHVGPRLGLTDEQVETIAWLVQHHLLLSRIAFKRDIEDPKTVSDVVEVDPVARAPAAAAGADRGRHPRGRAERLERLEGPAPARALPRDRRGAGRRRRQRPAQPADRGRQGRAGRGARRLAARTRSRASCSATTRATGSASISRRITGTPCWCAAPRRPASRSPSISRSTGFARAPRWWCSRPTIRACSCGSPARSR